MLFSKKRPKVSRKKIQASIKPWTLLAELFFKKATKSPLQKPPQTTPPTKNSRITQNRLLPKGQKPTATFFEEKYFTPQSGISPALGRISPSRRFDIIEKSLPNEMI
ncbi:MAG: hypothetical protein E7580_07055 [Ruminococcaceae bacterium]|nr:hypothetical protein [Oscillospiraceae bacterium]